MGLKHNRPRTTKDSINHISDVKTRRIDKENKKTEWKKQAVADNIAFLRAEIKRLGPSSPVAKLMIKDLESRGERYEK